MVKKLKKPKFKKLKKFKVMKARGGDAARSAAASGNMGGRADPSGGVDRSAVGEGSQYQANVQAQQNKKTSISPMAVASNVLTVAGMFTNPLAAVAKYGYSQFKKGDQNAMDYEGQAAGVTPMKTPTRTTTMVSQGNDNNNNLPTPKISTTIAPLFTSSPTKDAVTNFMIRPGVRLSSNKLGMSGQMFPKPTTNQFMVKPGVSLSDVSKASNGKLIKGHPKLAKKGWK